jgi:hypothetical protein
LRCNSNGLEPIVPISLTWDGRRQQMDSEFNNMMQDKEIFDQEIHE